VNLLFPCIWNQFHLPICESLFLQHLESMSFAHMWISFSPAFGINVICTYVNLLFPSIWNQCHLHICESPFPQHLESMSFAHMWISFCPTFGIKFICTYVNLLLPKDHLYCKRSLKCVKNYDDRRQAIL
jgi:hypothetical protein